MITATLRCWKSDGREEWRKAPKTLLVITLNMSRGCGEPHRMWGFRDSFPDVLLLDARAADPVVAFESCTRRTGADRLPSGWSARRPAVPYPARGRRRQRAAHHGRRPADFLHQARPGCESSRARSDVGKTRSAVGGD